MKKNSLRLLSAAAALSCTLGNAAPAFAGTPASLMASPVNKLMMTTGSAYLESQGSLGFFQYLADQGDSDAAAAIECLNDGVLGSYLKLGDANDATSLDNMKQALTIIENCNKYRLQEGRSPLKVSSQLMAISQKQTNYSAQITEHAQAYYVAENLAWGYSDPFDGWYHKEKAIYEKTGVKDHTTGHYFNIIDSSYSITGAGYIAKGRTSEQSFYYSGPGMDFDAYKSKFDQYYKDVKGNGSAAKPGDSNNGGSNGGNTNKPASKKVYSYDAIPSCGILVRSRDTVIIQGSPFTNDTSFNAVIFPDGNDLSLQFLFGSIPQDVLDAEKKYGKLVDYTEEDEPDNQKPTENQKPGSTQKPETQKPGNTQKPETQKPAENQKPGSTQKPVSSSVSVKIDSTLGKGEFTWSQSSDGSWSAKANGKVLKNMTAELAGKVYRFDNNGKMFKGFYKEDGKTYRFSTAGDLKFGWMQIDGRWYYSDKSGALQEGWIKDPSGSWYFMQFDFDGDPNSLAMLTGYLPYNGENYYLDSTGAMKTGWLNMYGFSQYFYTAKDAKKLGVKEGTMAVNTTINGYTIDANGYWVK